MCALISFLREAGIGSTAVFKNSIQSLLERAQRPMAKENQKKMELQKSCDRKQEAVAGLAKGGNCVSMETDFGYNLLK